MSSTHEFQLDNAAVFFGDIAALRSITLDIKPGERVALVGPSGAGKSTLLNLLNGTVKPTHGSVSALGKNFADQSPREIRRTRSRIGFIHQQLNLVPNLRVIQNVLLGRLGRMGLLQSIGLVLHPSDAISEEVYGLLDRVGIPDKMYQRTDQCSGGQQQRVAIARALFQQPNALLADEPVSSVDPTRAKDVVALLNRICEEENLTLVMSIHNLALAREFFPRLIGLRDGKILFDQASDSLSDEAFDSLYDLSDEEMLEDG